MDMIYTMAAISDCAMPVNMTFAQPISEPEFTITHFDGSTDEKRIESTPDNLKSEIRTINIDMKNKFEGGKIGKIYTGEPQF